MESLNIDERIKNIKDFTFLHGYYEPTMAILFEKDRTWAGRLQDKKDTMCLIIVSLDLSQRIYPVIHSVDGLPYDSFAVCPVPKPVGGVMVLSVNGVMHFDQGTRCATIGKRTGWLRSHDLLVVRAWL